MVSERPLNTSAADSDARERMLVLMPGQLKEIGSCVMTIVTFKDGEGCGGL